MQTYLILMIKKNEYVSVPNQLNWNLGQNLLILLQIWLLLLLFEYHMFYCPRWMNGGILPLP